MSEGSGRGGGLEDSGVAASIESAFRQLRTELAIREGFPPGVLEEAERVAKERIPGASASHADRTAIEFVTIDPPGSRDLDQAVQLERERDGYRVRYAIADVGFWVDRGSPIEREAWLRGVTFYAPDHREALYPPVLSAGVASLLPNQACPAVMFDFLLDASGELSSWKVERSLVRSRAQLTYTQLLEHCAGSVTESEPWAETLTLLGEIGPKRLALEARRGGVSLPIRDQHVQRSAAQELGYELVYERPTEAESWNAQISLLTGHAAATLMLEAGIGLLRTMPPFMERDLEKLRRIAKTLGFSWPGDLSYPAFMHAVDLANPHVEVLVRQARRVMRGADYIAFSGEPPEQPLHGALAMPYAHATAPLRRLADRYVLDLLVTLSSPGRPSDAEISTLLQLPAVMDEADRKTSAMERRGIDIAEARVLSSRIGDVVEAVVVDLRGREAEVQVEDPPVRAMVKFAGSQPPELGQRVELKVLADEGEMGAVLVA